MHRPRHTGLAAVTWDPASATVRVRAYVDDMLETVCGTLQLPLARRHTGTWPATVTDHSATAAGTSAPVLPEVP